MIFSSPPASSSISSTPTGAHAHDRARHDRAGVGDQHVAGIAVARQRVRDEAVIAGIAHRRIEEAVDHQRAGVLVHFVFDRFAANGHFDDDVDVVRRIDSDRDGVNAHGGLRLAFEGRAWKSGARQGPFRPAAEQESLFEPIRKVVPVLRKDHAQTKSLAQLVQAKATLSSDFGPNFSEERATMRPPSAR